MLKSRSGGDSTGQLDWAITTRHTSLLSSFPASRPLGLLHGHYGNTQSYWLGEHEEEGGTSLPESRFCLAAGVERVRVKLEVP